MDFKKRTQLYAIYKTLTWNISRSRVKEWAQTYHINTNQKKARVIILISDKVDFEAKTITKDKEKCHIMIKGSIHQEYITILTVYVPKHKAAKHMQQKLIEL